MPTQVCRIEATPVAPAPTALTVETYDHWSNPAPARATVCCCIVDPDDPAA